MATTEDLLSARGGGLVASLVPGPGARDRHGPDAQGTPEQGPERPGPPVGGPQAGDDQGAAEPGAQADGSGADAGAPPEDSTQQDRGSWGWGWWGSSAWQGGSSHGGRRDRHGRDDDDGDAWARWNCGGHGTRPGSHSGYGRNGRQRAKPAQTAAALGRNLTREGWIEELIADPPNPAHPEFRTPGAWERWVRGAFRAHKRIGDAKYKVKTKRANADMEVRGADPDFSNRGGRSTAMDPSTAFDPLAERGGGQKQQDRSRDDGGGRSAPVARGAAASSSSTWWSAGGCEGSTHQGNEHRDAGPSPAAGGEAAPRAALDGHAASAGHDAPPPPASAVAPGGAERGDDGAETGTPALNDGEAVPQPGTPDGNGDPGVPAAGAGSAEGDLGQVDGASGSRSRHGSPGPVVPSHCEGDATIGGAWPGGALDGDSSGGPVQDHGDTPGDCSATGAHDEQVLLLPLGAVCVGGGASSATQQGFGNGDGTVNGLPGDDGAAHRDGALRVKLEADARPSPSGVDAPPGSGAPAEALPVPSGVGDGGVRCGAGDDRFLEGASGADDGLPSFFPIDEEPTSPAGPGEAVLGAAAVHNTPGEEANARGRDLPLLTNADEGHEEGGQVDGTSSPGADAGGFPPRAAATGPGAQPHGVVSPPATTVFGGGIGVTPMSGADDNANIAHGGFRTRTATWGFHPGDHRGERDGGNGGPRGRPPPTRLRGRPAVSKYRAPARAHGTLSRGEPSAPPGPRAGGAGVLHPR